jgi:hypothetical protein
MAAGSGRDLGLGGFHATTSELREARSSPAMQYPKTPSLILSWGDWLDDLETSGAQHPVAGLQFAGIRYFAITPATSDGEGEEPPAIVPHAR